MNYQLVSAIFRHPWAIYEQAALGYGPMINNLINGSAIELEGMDEKPIFMASPEPGKAVSFWDMNDAPAGSVAVIPLSGPLMKNDQYCGPAGMATIGMRIKEADACENISAIILKIDSPGGTVDGTEALADIVAGIQKPIIAFVDGLMASAALWIGSHADEIYASSDTDEVGSVGVLLSFADVQPAYERQGVKFHQIVSNHSKDKTEWLDRILKGDYEDYKKDVLDPLAEKFQQVVREHRPGVKDEHLSGKVFFARDVIGAFIDKIGNFESALQRAFDLGQEFEKSNTTMSKKNETTEYTATMKVIGVESLESSKEGIFLNAEQMAAIEGSISEGEKAKSDLSAMEEQQNALEEGQTIQGLQEEAKKAEGLEEGETVASLKAENKRLAEDNEKLSKEPAKEETEVNTDGDEKDKKAVDPEAEKYFRLNRSLN